jgi:small subunit ribosomal protein S6
MRRYETIFILRPDLGEPAQKEAVKRFEGLIASNGGELIDTEDWGFRELSYRIKGEQRGFYVRLDYGGSGATMNEVERNLKLSDVVLRYLSVLVGDAVDPAAARSELATQRQKAAEARAAAEAARAAAEAARLAAAAERANQQAAAHEAPAAESAASPATTEDTATDPGGEQQS